MFKIDVFAVKDRPFDYAACRRTRYEVLDSKQGKQFVLAAPEDVILNKLEWYRLGEEMSDRQWRDVIEVIRIQHGRLDLEHLEFWARELKVLDLLNEAITEVENKEA